MRVNSRNSDLIAKLRRENSNDTFGNPYIQKAKQLEGLLYTLEEIGESFPNIFKDNNLPIILEIGCYKGANVVELGQHNPNVNILGIEVRYKRVVKSCEKITNRQLTNCKIAIGEANELLGLIPAESITGAFVFFPDPWLKERQRKNRLLNEDFLKRLQSRLKPGGFLWFKTDDKEYFEDSLVLAREVGYEAPAPWPQELVEREYKSRFQELFISQGKPTYQAVMRK